jgi:hypothetical protein
MHMAQNSLNLSSSDIRIDAEDTAYVVWALTQACPN